MKEGRLLGPRSVLILPLLLVFAIGARPAAAQVSAWTEGNTIRYRIDKIAAPNGDDSYCVVEITLSDGRSTAYGTAPPCTYTPAQNSAFYCNKTGTYVLSAWARSPSAPGYFMGQTSVTVAEPPPVTCPQFEVVVPTTKILTHKYDDGATYPNGQIEDGKVPIKVIPRVAPAGTVVHLRLYDPPDSSVYGGPHDWNDNFDPAAGTIDGDKTTQVTLPETGAVDVLLAATDFAAGDNYEIHYSTDAALLTDDPSPCTPPQCRRTPVLTAWKRMYLEIRKMWRVSEPLAVNAIAGQSVVYVNDKSAFHKGHAVTLLHAPSYLRDHPNDTNGFYSEDRTITKIAKNQNVDIAAEWEITLNSPLNNDYYVETIANVNVSDAIGNRSQWPGKSPNPVYDVDTRYVLPLFSEAFVDVVAKAGPGGGTIPHYEATTLPQLVFASHKWLAAKTTPQIPPNHGLVVAAATGPPPDTPKEIQLGSTSGTSFSWVWTETIESACSGPASKYPLLSKSDPVLTAAEVLVHEIAHQWNVNGGPPGHCARTGHSDSSKTCLMNVPTPSGQHDDGYVAFHHLAGTSQTTTDSEYSTIRTAPEPKP